MSVSTGCVCQLWTEALDMMMPYRIIADNTLLCHHCDYPAGGETVESTYMCDSWEDHDKWLYFYEEPLKPSKILCQQGTLLAQSDVWLLVFFLIANVSDYEASLKKEGGIPDGPVLESLLAGETLDKKVETKEEESMSECQVRLCSAPNCFLRPRLLDACPVDLFLSVCVTLCVGDSLCLWLCVALFWWWHRLPQL